MLAFRQTNTVRQPDGHTLQRPTTWDDRSALRSYNYVTDESTWSIRWLNQTQSPFLRLSGEIRNKIYECVASNETLTIARDHRKTHTALNLSLVCYQIFKEMHLLPYSVPIDVYSLTVFVAWLNKRTEAQRKSITSFDMRSLLLLDGLAESHAMVLRRSGPLEVDGWPNLSNLKNVRVHLIPYDRNRIIEPIHANNIGLWLDRAQDAADTIAEAARAPSKSEKLEISGIWEPQWAGEQERLHLEACIARAGFVWDNVEERWQLCLPAPRKY